MHSRSRRSCAPCASRPPWRNGGVSKSVRGDGACLSRLRGEPVPGSLRRVAQEHGAPVVRPVALADEADAVALVEVVLLGAVGEFLPSFDNKL